MGILQDKVVIVTGSVGNLGRIHCTHLAKAGAVVVMTDIHDEPDGLVASVIAESGQAAQVIYRSLDVTDWVAAHHLMDSIATELGSVDALVNNAAYGGRDDLVPFLDLTPETWERVLTVDLTGMFICSHAAVGVMSRQNSGSIINISSGTVGINLPNMVPYVTAKCGVIGFTRALATDAAEFNIRVNTVLPGMFPPLEGPEPGSQELEMYEGFLALCTERQILKRQGDPNDLAPMICFLASDEARWITGQAIAVDGGLVRTSV